MTKFYGYLSYSLFIFFTFSSVTIAQTPCSGGTSSGYPCDAVALSSRIDLTTFTAAKGNDVWGYKSPSSGKEYAIMGLNNGTVFVEVTVPTAPVFLGKLAIPSGAANSSWRDIRTKNGYAYIGSEATGHGIQIFDLAQLDIAAMNPSSLPVTFTSAGVELFSSSARSHNMVTNLDPNSNFIYAVGTAGFCGAGMTAFDVSTTPTNPDYISCYSQEGYNHDMLCINYRGPDTEHIGKEICIGFNADHYSIVDVTDKTDVTLISSNVYTGEGYTHQGTITDDHKYLLLDDELDERDFSHNTRTYVFDISDLNVPVFKFYFENNNAAIDHNMFAIGPYAYQANYEAGLRILDISDLDNDLIQEAAYFDLTPSRTTANFNGAWGVYPYLPSGNLLISGINNLTVVIDPETTVVDQAGGLFVLAPQLPHVLLTTAGAEVQEICAGDNVSFTFNKIDRYGFIAAVTYAVDNLTDGLTGAVTTSGNLVTVNITNTGGLNTNQYFTLTATPGDATPTSRISGGIVFKANPTAAPLLVPADQSVVTQNDPTLIWTPDDNTETYTVQIATDAGFTNIIETAANLMTNQFVPSSLTDGGEYHWRVTSVNTCSSTTSVVYSFNVNSGVVPVELVSFNGKYNGKYNDLFWRTASELNNIGFEVERQMAHKDREFLTIGFQTALGDDGGNYQFQDKNILAGHTYYYRLKQKDFDGSFSYSDIISITIPGKKSLVELYPNPVSATLTVDLFLGDITSEDEVLLQIYDLSGRIRQSILTAINDDFTSVAIDTESLPTGVYILNILGNNIQLPHRFVKK